MYHLWSREDKLLRGQEDDPTIRIVDDLLYEALIQRASDIHLESIDSGLLVRYRLDGVLYDHCIVDVVQKNLIFSRLKVLASLDISQCRLPQDGKSMIVFHTSQEDVDGRQIDIRVSTFPCLHGEKMVLRLLDRSTHLLRFNDLGMSGEIAASVQSYFRRLSGLFLVTGPTGSGKTTTLYSSLLLLNAKEKNIVTMEDPIEYELEGINQSQVNERAGFTFDIGLRSMLRQDPDHIMIGEIRDVATVSIAIEAALTGHLVLSTLHTSSAALAITRLIEMGIEPFLISASVGGILAQRLARRLCDSCKQEEVPNAEIINFIEFYVGRKIKKVYKAVGCYDCAGRGYRGRVGIFEWLECTEQIKSLIINKATTKQIEQQAKKQKMASLLDDAISKFEQGIIDYQELLALGAD